MESLTANIPSSFVKRKHKLVIDKGNGEAKLYIGSIKDEETYNKFLSTQLIVVIVYVFLLQVLLGMINLNILFSILLGLIVFLQLNKFLN